MEWIFLSPHLDDVVLSCGGLIAERVQHGDSVEIWTACAGDPPAGRLTAFARMLHQRWDTPRNAVAIRRLEDMAACQKLGATARHFSIPDCIYRRDSFTGEPLIRENEDLFRGLPESELGLVAEIQRQLAATLPAQCQVVSPLTIGNHVDHQLVRHAAERLNRVLWYYADFPYAANTANDLATLIRSDWHRFTVSISSRELISWQAAVAEYKSQLSTFWNSPSEMENAIRDYVQAGGGCTLWSRNESPITNL